VHPEEVHGQNATEDDGGRPAASSGGESAEGVLNANVDMEGDAREEKDDGKDLVERKQVDMT
jgi:hypothetical protein